jgi:hypothetical protein
MISELGFVYFFASTAMRNVLRVCAACQLERPTHGRRDFSTHIQCMQIRHAMRIPQLRNRPREELPRLQVEVQQLAGRDPVEDAPQRRPIRLEQEKLAPEALGFIAVVVILDHRRH